MSHEAPGVEVRPIPGFPGYYAGVDGSVWSFRSRFGDGGRESWKQLTQGTDAYGRKTIALRPDGKQCGGGRPKVRFVHQLVLLAFVGPCPEGMLACHGNDNPADNRPENLRWDTPKANNADALRNHRIRRGGKSHKARLIDSDIPVLRYLIARGVSPELVAVVFDVSFATIDRIVRGKQWRQVEGPPAEMTLDEILAEIHESMARV